MKNKALRIFYNVGVTASILWLLISSIPFLIFDSLSGFYAWGMLNQFIGQWIEKNIVDTKFLLVLATSIINALFIGIICGLLGTFVHYLFLRITRSIDPTGCRSPK